jgi:hypothetical protein
MTTKILSTEFNALIEHIEDVSILNMFDTINVSNEKKKVLNIQKLAKTLLTGILKLSDYKINIDPKDDNIIKGFMSSIVIAIEKFCNFLDYDNDGIIELVRHNENGTIIEGEDIELMVKDGKAIINSFKDQGDPVKTTVVILTQLVAYFMNDRVTLSRKKFIEFEEECTKAYICFKQVKSIKYLQFFSNNSDNMIKFVINMCIIIIPIIDLVNKRNAISKLDSIQNLTITKDDVKKATFDMYGSEIEFILTPIDNLVYTIVRNIEGSKKCKAFFNSIKNKCCCCTDATTYPN